MDLEGAIGEKKAEHMVSSSWVSWHRFNGTNVAGWSPAAQVPPRTYTHSCSKLLWSSHVTLAVVARREGSTPVL